MAKLSLIGLLTKHQDKSPDDIVNAINMKGWMRPKDMTQDYFERHKDRPSVWCCVYPNPNWPPVMGRPGWKFSHCSRDFNVFVNHLENDHHIYWLIDEAEWTYDSEPPSVAECQRL